MSNSELQMNNNQKEPKNSQDKNIEEGLKKSEKTQKFPNSINNGSQIMRSSMENVGKKIET